MPMPVLASASRALLVPPEVVLWDSFTRVDSTTTLGAAETGQSYTAGSGTWGISSNQGYDATDANNNFATAETYLANGWIRGTISGEILSGVTLRVPWIVFRFLNANVFLEVGLNASQVALRKNDTGFTTLATAAQTTTDGTAYTLDAFYVGNTINVRVDGVHLITYTLAGTDLKYAGYTSVGMHLSKAGVPATAARWDDLIVRRLR